MATILKQSQLQLSGADQRLVAFNIDDVQQRAQAYLQQVRQQAAEMLAAAQREAESVRNKARSEGQADAQKDLAQQVEDRARQLTEERIRTATAACQQAVDSLSSDTTQWLQEWRDVTIDLAIAMAEKLVRQSMAQGLEPLRVWLEEALMLMRDARDVHILVHPDDFTWAGRYLQQMAKHVPHAGTAEILPDPEVSRGGCIVRCGQGQIDQQLESQLARLGEQLR
ncbi:MAG: FliH/SctL family protein [Aureliella sp.]|jgi:flagellar biosynthesis/type III secretory pathway protein FliH